MKEMVHCLIGIHGMCMRMTLILRMRALVLVCQISAFVFLLLWQLKTTAHLS